MKRRPDTDDYAVLLAAVWILCCMIAVAFVIFSP